MKKAFFILVAVLTMGASHAWACTGISLRGANGAYFMARTIEWGGNELASTLTIVPRGHTITSLTPSRNDGMRFTARYGFVGIALVQGEFIAEGLNEAGLSAGLFYFPRYGSYEPYNAQYDATTLADMQVVSWLLARCATVEEVKKTLPTLHIVSLMPEAQASANAIHWRVGDAQGNQIVIEIEHGKLHIYDNPVGVITNAPNFSWHLQNLNNYVNLFPGSAPARQIGDTLLIPFGAGSGFLGLPGDVTPPSRFVRAALYTATAPRRADAMANVMQCFTILDNFNIPVGIEFPADKVPDIPSATQWTSVSDLGNRTFYYKTMYNSTLRKIDLREINFATVGYRTQPLDRNKQQPVETLRF